MKGVYVEAKKCFGKVVWPCEPSADSHVWCLVSSQWTETVRDKDELLWGKVRVPGLGRKKKIKKLYWVCSTAIEGRRLALLASDWHQQCPWDTLLLVFWPSYYFSLWCSLGMLISSTMRLDPQHAHLQHRFSVPGKPVRPTLQSKEVLMMRTRDSTQNSSKTSND